MTALRFTVTESDTAIALGSGDVPVLATPRLLAWLEAATVVAAGAHLQDGQTSVGTHVELRHRRATAVGRTVRIEVTSVRRSGTRLQFGAAAFEVAAVQAPPLEVAAVQAPPLEVPAVQDPPLEDAVPEDPAFEEPVREARTTSEAAPIATALVTRAIVDRNAFLAALARG